MVILKEYSLRYVTELLYAAGAQVRKYESFHIGSAAALAIGLPPAVAWVLSAADRVLSILPSMRAAGSNIILVAQRR